MKTESIDLSDSDSPITKYYKLAGLNVALKAPQYSLPLDTANVENFEMRGRKLVKLVTEERLIV